jgi:hypothetical protein
VDRTDGSLPPAVRKIAGIEATKCSERPQEELNSVTGNPRGKKARKTFSYGQIASTGPTRRTPEVLPPKTKEPARTGTLENVTPGQHTNIIEGIETRKSKHDEESEIRERERERKHSERSGHGGAVRRAELSTDGISGEQFAYRGACAGEIRRQPGRITMSEEEKDWGGIAGFGALRWGSSIAMARGRRGHRFGELYFGIGRREKEMGGRREESGERGVTAFPSRQIPGTGLSTDSTTSLPNTRDAPVVVGCHHDVIESRHALCWGGGGEPIKSERWY